MSSHRFGSHHHSNHHSGSSRHPSNGDDVINLGSGNDNVNAGNGDDRVDGGAGNDYIDGGNGNDILRGGAGNDVVNGGRGNDTIIYRADATAGSDVVNGGQGRDTLVLELTASQQADALFIADIAAFYAYLAGCGNGAFQFQSMGLKVTGGFEALRIVTVTDSSGPTNTAPTVSGPVSLVGGTEDTSYVISTAALLANATDAEGNAMSIANLQASSGSVSNKGNGTFTYTPVANANGLVTFSYSVSDGALSTATSADLNLVAVNDAPTAGAAVVLPAAAEDSSIIVSAAQLLANAGDVDGNTLSVVNLQASSGALINNNNGTYSFTPLANDDTSVTFTYQISDGTVSVFSSASLELTAVNDGPVVGAEVVLAAVAEDNVTSITAAQLLSNASDIDGDGLSILNLQSSSGTLSFGAGTYSFTPAANDDTAVIFTYQISDGTASVTATASLDLTPVNDLPVFGLNSHLDVHTYSGIPLGGVITGFDVETAPQDLVFSLHEGGGILPSGFVLVEATGEFIYVPDSELAETMTNDSFQVMVTDADGGSNITTVNITLQNNFTELHTVYANTNRGALVGTLIIPDQFIFNNVVADGVSSGYDYLVNFSTGDDLIRLQGDSFDVADIIAGATTNAVGNFIYAISETGATIESNIALSSIDFASELLF